MYAVGLPLCEKSNQAVGKKGKAPFVWRNHDKSHTFKLANLKIVP
jgi:hypothetical protein